MRPRQLVESQAGLPSSQPSSEAAHTPARPRFLHIGESQTSSTPRRRRKVDVLAGESLDGSQTPQTPSSSLRVLSPAVRIHVLRDGRLSDDDVARLSTLAQSLGALVLPSQHLANLLLCSVRSAKRISKYLDDEAKRDAVPVLHFDWLDDCARRGIMQPYREYWVAPEGECPVGAGEEGASEEGPSEERAGEETATRTVAALDAMDSEDEEPVLVSKSQLGKRPRSPSPIAKDRRDDDDDESYGSREEWEDDEDELAPSASTSQPRSSAPRYRNEAYACFRPSPLVCVNQDLVRELDVLRLSRSFAGPHNTHQSASYSRAISAIKAFPEPLSQQPTMARRLKGVGKKIAMLIEQYYAEGSIAEATQIRSDRSFQLMCEFTELYGIGPKRARELYQQGCRSLDDVVRTGTSIAMSIPMDECLRILPDLRLKIPRAEVEYIAELIQAEMDAIRPGTVHTICGGYRRGKPQSNDVDVVMTLPTMTGGDEQRRLLDALLWALKRRGLMTHTVTVRADRSELPTSRVDVAAIVFLPLAKPGVVTKPTHRRVDLIFCQPRIYGAAILGWTGSRQFEKDLRRLATQRGFKFHSSGLVPLANLDHVETTPKEEDVFRFLDLDYMPPELRNCDA